MRLAVAQALQSPINQLIGAMGVALILTIWVIQSRSGAATIGDFVSFVTAMLMMFSPLRHLSDINSQLQRGLVAAQSVFSLIDDQPEIDIGTKRLETVRGEIRFERVFMTYPSRDQPALSDVSLVIPAGKTIAVVGPSGGGKSTLINLLPRIYPFQEGRITLDGVDIQELSLSFLRKQIALVSQDVVLFNASIADNISYGHTIIRADRIEAAVQAADLTDFVQSLPQGLNTLVGDRGVRVSGGQRQRIAIARAILKDAPILILDEATSALDSTTEASIKASVEALRKNRTTIVVAHRLSTVVDADLICVFDQGKLVQQGTHAELVVKSGLYQSLYSQMQILENTAK
jgi:subfamily B ATP-binding cassette protein MsbA